MRSMWTGTISFGLLNVPVKLYGATAEHGATLHRTHETCLVGEYSDAGHRLSQRMVCKDCEEEVPYAEQGSVFVDTDGTTIVLTPEELAALPGAKSRDLALTDFIDPSEVDPMRYGKAYYLRPDKKGARPYVLLLEALRRSELGAVGRITLRSRESLVMVTAREDMLIAQVILWSDELRAPEFAEGIPAVAITDEDISQAASLLESARVKFDITHYTDTREVALAELIESKRRPVEPVNTGAQIIQLFGHLAADVKAG